MSKSPKEHKTNAIREVEASGLPFNFKTFEATDAPSGVEVANILGLDAAKVFKTLVTQGKSGTNYVFMIPAAHELDLKKAASAVDEKSIAMIKSRELLPLTGYVHGGCSPIGMKKKFATVIDSSAQASDTIYFSGGRIGCQIEMSPLDLAKLIDAKFREITE